MRRRFVPLMVVFFAIILTLNRDDVRALVATPSFRIFARNITLPSSGSGSIPITLTSLNGYTGIVLVSCLTVTPPAGVLEPYCEPPHFGPVLSYRLSASKPTVAGRIPITSIPEPTAAVSHLNHSGRFETLTPGTYTYTIRAFDQGVPQKFARTTVKVTVLPGIPIMSGSKSGKGKMLRRDSETF